MRFTTLFIGALCLLPCAAAAQSDAPRPRSTLLYSVSQGTKVNPEASVLDLVTRRFNLVIRDGHFMSDRGVVTTCIMTRRNATRPQVATGELPHCPMVSVYLDHVLIGNPGAYLRHLRLGDVESVELINTSDGNAMYSFTIGAMDVLVVWTRGQGPFARK